MNKAEKQDRVDALRQQLAGIDAVIVAEYRGMTVEQMQSLRTAVRGAEGKVVVVKNTLARLSVKGTSLEALSDKLVGPVLMTFGPDVVGPAKAIVKIAKDVPNLVITGGALAGKALSAAQVKSLSELPGRDELRAMLLGTLNAVPAKFVGTLAASPRSILNVFNARIEQLEPKVEAEAA
jgi:large subunit ribosomal protein L10